MKAKSALLAHPHADVSVGWSMRQVMLAALPALLVQAWFFSPGVLINAAIAMTVALLSEALTVRLRGRPWRPCVADGSAAVTGLLLAMALPPLSPWWLTALGTTFGIVVAKHLYGGLGYNPFNPAMVGYVVLLIAFPREMTSWLPPRGLVPESPDFLDALQAVFLGHIQGGPELDALTMASPLDLIKTQLALAKTLEEVWHAPPFGEVGGHGWELVDVWLLLGGVWLMVRRVITWHIPVSTLGALVLIALVFHIIDPSRFASPLFHLFSGAAMLGAFFIATDPVTASTTPRGRLVYGAGIGILIYVIRTWGGYPDGVAFAVLLMNLAAPTIDHYTQPRVYGHGGDAHP